MSKKKAVSDFRYNTGEAKIPWAAVGEPIREEDVLETIRFLMPAAEGKNHAYEKSFQGVAKAVANLRQQAKYAGKLTLGNRVKSLEDEIARYLKAKYALFVTNATAGFEIAYKLAGLKPGDEVIAPAITFIATIAYPLSMGAKVVLADVDRRTLNMDPRDVARKITSKTRIIFPVHIGGYPADMNALMRLARPRGITVIEDAAHAFGAKYHGKMIGTIGHFGAFSFHEVKNVTAFGEGGILVTNLPCGREFAKSRFLGLDLSRKIKNWLYDVVAVKSLRGCFAAGNHSATEIQALGLAQQLGRMSAIIAKRKAAAEYLNKRFSRVAGIIPPPGDTPDIKSTHHLYLLQIDPAQAGGDVQTLKEKLMARGIVNIPHFGPLYKFSVMRQMGYNTRAIEKTCPVTEEVFNRCFTHLPLYDFTPQQLNYLADTVIAVVNEMKAKH